MTTHREAVLLTPGPLTTSLRTKLAMLKDWGSWDSDFIAITARVRQSLLDIVHGHDSHVVVPLQGSGTSKQRWPRWCRETATCWCLTTVLIASGRPNSPT